MGQNLSTLQIVPVQPAGRRRQPISRQYHIPHQIHSFLVPENKVLPKEIAHRKLRPVSVQLAAKNSDFASIWGNPVTVLDEQIRSRIEGLQKGSLEDHTKSVANKTRNEIIKHSQLGKGDGCRDSLLNTNGNPNVSKKEILPKDSKRRETEIDDLKDGNNFQLLHPINLDVKPRTQSKSSEVTSSEQQAKYLPPNEIPNHLPHSAYQTKMSGFYSAADNVNNLKDKAPTASSPQKCSPPVDQCYSLTYAQMAEIRRQKYSNMPSHKNNSTCSGVQPETKPLNASCSESNNCNRNRRKKRQAPLPPPHVNKFIVQPENSLFTSNMGARDNTPNVPSKSLCPMIPFAADHEKHTPQTQSPGISNPSMTSQFSCKSNVEVNNFQSAEKNSDQSFSGARIISDNVILLKQTQSNIHGNLTDRASLGDPSLNEPNQPNSWQQEPKVPNEFMYPPGVTRSDFNFSPSNQQNQQENHRQSNNVYNIQPYSRPYVLTPSGTMLTSCPVVINDSSQTNQVNPKNAQSKTELQFSRTTKNEQDFTPWNHNFNLPSTNQNYSLDNLQVDGESSTLSETSDKTYCSLLKPSTSACPTTHKYFPSKSDLTSTMNSMASSELNSDTYQRYGSLEPPASLDWSKGFSLATAEETKMSKTSLEYTQNVCSAIPCNQPTNETKTDTREVSPDHPSVLCFPKKDASNDTQRYQGTRQMEFPFAPERNQTFTERDGYLRENWQLREPLQTVNSLVESNAMEFSKPKSAAPPPPPLPPPNPPPPPPPPLPSLSRTLNYCRPLQRELMDQSGQNSLPSSISKTSISSNIMKGLETIFKEDIIEARNSLRSMKKPPENSDSVKPTKKDLHEAFYYELTQTCLTRRKKRQEESFSKLPNGKNQILGNVVDRTKKHTEDLQDKKTGEKFSKLSPNNSFNSNSSENLKINGDFKSQTSLKRSKQPNWKSEKQKETGSARLTTDWTPMQDLEESENSDTESSSVKNSQRNNTTGFKYSLIPENIKYLNNTKEFYSKNCPKPEYNVPKNSFSWKNEQNFIKSNSNQSKNGKETNAKTCEASENIGWEKSGGIQSNSKYKNEADIDCLEKQNGEMSEQHHLGRVKHEGENEKENENRGQSGWNVWKKHKKFPKESTVNMDAKQELKVSESQISQKEEDMERERLSQMEVESEFLKKRSNQRLVMGNWRNKLTKSTKQSLAGIYDLEEERKNYTNNDPKEAAGFNEDIMKCNENTRKESEKAASSKNEVNFNKTRAQLQETLSSLNGSVENQTKPSKPLVSNNEGQTNDILLKPQIEKQNGGIYFPNSLAPNYVPNPFLGLPSSYFGTSYLNEYLKIVGVGQPFLPMNLTYNNIPGYLGTNYNMMPQTADIYAANTNFMNPLPFLPSVFNNFSAMSESKSKDVQNPVYTSDSDEDDEADSLYQSPGTYTDQMSNWSSDISKSIQTEDPDNSDSTQSSDVYTFQANKGRDEDFDSGNAFSSEFETMTSRMKYSILGEQLC